MPPKAVILPYEEKQPHLAAAMYLAVLVYPKNLKKRTDFVNACRAWWIKGESGKFPRGKIYNPAIRAFSESERIQREFNRASKILIKRQNASQIALFSMLKLAVPVKINRKNYTIGGGLDYLYARKTQSDSTQAVNNAFIRIWKESLPVIHLFIGMKDAAYDIGIKQYYLEDLLQNPYWVKNAVYLANEQRKMANFYKGSPLKHEVMIPVTLAPPTP